MSYYNQGPPGPPYQQQHSQYPPQQQPYGQQGYNQGHPPMNQGYQQSGYPPQGYPPQGYPPQGPPPGQYQQPPGAPYGQGPPQGQYYQGPPGPPPGQYGAPPGQYGAPPPGNYGPPPGQQQIGLPTPASEGYIPGQQPPYPMQKQAMERHAHDLRNAMKGLGTNEQALIKVLASLKPLEVAAVKKEYEETIRRDLMKDVHGETSGYFREGLEAIIRGPLDQDCHAVHEAIKGLGTKESAMNDVLLSRSNADLNAIKHRYQQIYKRSLESDVKGDLSFKTERLFDMVLSARRAEESALVIPQQIDADVQELYRATEGKAGTDEIIVCQILSSRSNGQLRALSQAYKDKFHRSLDHVLRGEFSGHMEDALIYMVRAAEDPAKHDADLLEESMKGAGTKDVALVRRIVALHWNRDRMHQCKQAYKHFYKQDLVQRIKGETSGDYEKLIVACV